MHIKHCIPVILLATVREDLGRDLNDLESESSGLLFLRFLCRSPLVDRMRDEQVAHPSTGYSSHLGLCEGRICLLLRICMWLLAAFDPHMLQIQGPRLADCIVHLILLLLVNLRQLPPFMWQGMALRNSRRLFLTNCYFWTALKSRRNCSVSCCFPGFPWKVDTIFLCIRICPIPSLALWSTLSVSVIFISLTLRQRQGPAYSGPTLCCHAFLLSLLFSVHCPSRPRKLFLVSGCWGFEKKVILLVIL